MKKLIILLSAAIAVIILLGGCKTSEGSAPVVTDGMVMINGTKMAPGQDNVKVNFNTNDKMTFRAMFTDPDGNKTIKKAVVSYNVKMMMMEHSGEITMWDDGTHGDMTPGDGWYHMEDNMSEMMEMMGIDWNNMMGDYEFEFYCFDEDDHESNHYKVNISLN